MMTKTSCITSHRIAAYLSGELDDAQSLVFEEHLDDCEICAAEMRTRLILNREVAGLLAEGATGAHLDDKFIENLARGEVNFSAIAEENLHLAACDACFARLRRADDRAAEQLRAAGAFHYPAADFYIEGAERLAAGVKEHPAQDPRAFPTARRLMGLRQFQLELFCAQNGVYVVAWLDDAEELDEIEVSAPGEGHTQSIEGTPGEGRRLFYLGSIQELSGRSLRLCFTFEGERWCRDINFGPPA